MDYFGEIDDAVNVFMNIKDSDKDSVTVNSIMNVLINNKMDEKALEIFEEYRNTLDEVSYVLAIKACNNVEDYSRGIQIYEGIDGGSFDGVHLKCAMIDLYGNYCQIDKALDIFKSISDDDLNIVCINSLMEAYYKNEENLQCIQLYQSMRKMYKKLLPDAITYAILLKACTEGSHIEHGQKVHKELEKDRNKEMLKQVSINVHLINMYGRFGMIQECEQIFGDFGSEHKDVSIWNAMISAYGRNGDIQNAKRLYDDMKAESDLAPNVSTYVLLFNGCSHCGDIETAIQIYKYEIEDIEIKYHVYIVTNIIDCYSRNGLLDDGYKLILEYEDITGNTATEVMWTSLLHGCKKFENESMTELVHQNMCNRFESVK